MKSIALAASLALLCALGTSSSASASKVEGFGSLSTNLSPPLQQIDKEFEASAFLTVGDALQLNAGDIGPGNSKLLQYGGEAQFGRLGVRSSIGGQAPTAPNLSTGVDVFTGFEDRITPEGLDPTKANFLRLDIGVSGRMIGGGATDSGASTGKGTTASFVIQLLSLDSSEFRDLVSLTFAWLGNANGFFLLTNESNGGLDTPRFIPDTGEEPSFTPFSGGFAFGARGHVDVPLDAGLLDGADFLGFGDPFLLSIAASASSSCPNEKPACLADTNFGSTALIGNARIVDGNGDPIQGASFSSESGYDYLTPPGPIGASVPEPASTVLLAAGLAFMLLRNRARA